MFEEITALANNLERYTFLNLNGLKDVKNGIYLIFENGEKVGDLDRIVRVGSHPSQDRFYKRLTDHFTKRQRASIMRKHIGRCLLNRKKDCYIQIWNLSNVKVKKGTLGGNLVDKEKESLIENRVSSYLNNLTISVIPSLHDKTKRMQLENKLIATLNLKNWNFISKNWLGNYHPNSKIVNSGLWNIQGLNGNQYLTKKDLDFINDKTRYRRRR